MVYIPSDGTAVSSQGAAQNQRRMPSGGGVKRFTTFRWFLYGGVAAVIVFLVGAAIAWSRFSYYLDTL